MNREHIKAIELVKEKYYRPYIITVIVLVGTLVALAGADDSVKQLLLILIILCFVGLIIFRIIDYLSNKQKHEQKSLTLVNETKVCCANNLGFMFYQLLREELKGLSKKRKFREVIRLGNAISRILWLNMEYESRVQIGHIVHDATVMENDEEARIRLLVDDIGWTNLFIGKKEFGIKNLQEGIELAEKGNYHFYASKGIRHMANVIMLFEKGNPNLVKQYLDRVTPHIDRMTDGDDKIESILSYNYSMTEYLIYSGDITKALENSLQNKEAYSNVKDFDRLCKVFAQLGRIYYLNNDYAKAKEYFLRGVSLSEKQNRLDSIIKCYMGLVVCYYYDKHTPNLSEVSEYISCCEMLFNNKIFMLDWEDINPHCSFYPVSFCKSNLQSSVGSILSTTYFLGRKGAGFSFRVS